MLGDEGAATRRRHRARELGGGVELEGAVQEGPAEGGLEPAQELDPLEAAQAEVALERGPGRGGAGGAVAAHLEGQLAHDDDHALDA